MTLDRRIFEFSLRFGSEFNFILQFLIEKHQNLEKRREKIFLWKMRFFRILRLWGEFFSQNLFDFFVFVATVGEIGLNTSRSRRKNSRLRFFRFFGLGRSSRNFDAFPLRKTLRNLSRFENCQIGSGRAENWGVSRWEDLVVEEKFSACLELIRSAK